MKKVLEHIKHIYFLGIGGIGMSALARYFMTRGVRVSGYDKTPSDLTSELFSEGANIHFNDDPSLIPHDIDFIIYTPAVPKDLLEFETLAKSSIPMHKRAHVAGLVTKGKTTVAVAGSHGKTSISSLTSHILKSAGYPVTALIGGISRNYGSNFITSGQEDIMIVEADEFDRSFLELAPDFAVISAMDPDHLDVYGTSEEMESSFAEFVQRIKPNGYLVIRHDLQIPIRKDIHRTGYQVDNLAEAFAYNLRIGNGLQLFDMFIEGVRYTDIKLMVPGRHNVENALAASLVCNRLGVKSKEIINGIETFTGVKRRFDFRIRKERLVYIDDYAHHPRELEAFIKAVREFYPGAKLTGLFQPHLFTRTRDFAEGFAASMDLLDEPWLLDIYPARELPIMGVTSAMILEKMQNPAKLLLSRAEVLQRLQQSKPEVFLTMGAGDIDQMIIPIEITLLQ
jgi:UDP-N-acetylmuramate--alanine ligase